MASVDAPGPADPADRGRPGPTGWVLHFDVDAANRRAVESLTTVADGRFGTRGLLWHPSRPGGPAPVTVAGGVYDDGEVPELLPAPAWTTVRLDLDRVIGETAELDLYRGVVTTEITGPVGTVWAQQFASIAAPGLCGLQVIGPIDALDDDGAVLAEPVRTSARIDRVEPGTMTVSSSRGAIAAAGTQTVADHHRERTITRLVAFAADRGQPDPDRLAATARKRADESHHLGFDALLARHEAAWADRWQPVTVELPADPELQIALRFAQFHLLSNAPEDHDAAVGARGLTGPAYRGHVFWDTDVFVVPALAAMAPPLARAALQYRAHRLDAARQRATAEGRAGARFPWESAHDGLEAAPTVGRDLRGNRVPIRTGQLEEHIVADVAWAFSTYLDWTGDTTFAEHAGHAVLIETARYWHSRVDRDSDGTAHIRNVIGPDEYHDPVDDNAYTNIMAAWNLRRAAALGEDHDLTPPEEWRAWRDTAERLVTGYDPDLGVHEQHAGFFDLEPVMAASLGPPPPISADALLGRDRVQRTQIIKQPDVIMLHHLLPDGLAHDALGADLDFYLPRTAHGSSLSPGITASVLARAGRTAEALEFFTMAARFDLDDLSGTTAGGLHLATMGGLWQAFTNGFLGVRATQPGLTVDPRIPEAWATVTHRFLYRGAQVRIRASADSFTVTASDPIDLVVGAQTARGRRSLAADKTSDSWRPR